MVIVRIHHIQMEQAKQVGMDQKDIMERIYIQKRFSNNYVSKANASAVRRPATWLWMRMRFAEARRSGRRLLRRTDQRPAPGLRQACIRPTSGLLSLLSPASPNSNDIRLTAQFNCIRLAQYSISIRSGKISDFTFLNDSGPFEFSKNAHGKFLLREEHQVVSPLNTLTSGPLSTWFPLFTYLLTTSGASFHEIRP